MTDPAPVRRLAAMVEYDGTRFHGWQRQAGSATVQGVVEQALSFVADHPVAVTCAGRTDAGVHATAQVIHFDTPALRSEHGWLRGSNTRLPDGVAIHWIGQVSGDFHARFGARRRRYRYILLAQPVAPALLHARVAWIHRPLHVPAMADAAACLLGRHDFSAFRAAACQSKNPVKTLYRLCVRQHGDFTCLDLEADGFLHHMVRNIAGVLMRIGHGEAPVSWCAEVLASGDRRLGGVTAPPGGLYLTGVDYDDVHGLPPAPPAPRFW